MTDHSRTPFYVGYLPTPPGLKLFLASIAAGLVGCFAALALALGTAQDDTGDGAFQWGWGPQTVTGVVDLKPYPMLHVTRGSDRIPNGRTLLLSGIGKNGVQRKFAKFDGQMVTVKGIALKRGSIDALQVGGGQSDVVGTDDVTVGVPPQSMGRWRLKGEICDGKCLAGAMRPGRGLAHRACANLCLIGGIPPVFVSAAPVDGTEFFVMGDQNGEPLPQRLLDHVAIYVSIDGEVERRGTILIFKIDLDTLKVL
ncbi:MAG: hypothetical protein ACR2PG_06740 [Hyphomicrobiaceae bacterium]